MELSGELLQQRVRFGADRETLLTAKRGHRGAGLGLGRIILFKPGPALAVRHKHVTHHVFPKRGARQHDPARSSHVQSLKKHPD